MTNENSTGQVTQADNPFGSANVIVTSENNKHNNLYTVDFTTIDTTFCTFYDLSVDGIDKLYLTDIDGTTPWTNYIFAGGTLAVITTLETFINFTLDNINPSDFDEIWAKLESKKLNNSNSRRIFINRNIVYNDSTTNIYSNINRNIKTKWTNTEFNNPLELSIAVSGAEIRKMIVYGVQYP